MAIIFNILFFIYKFLLIILFINLFQNQLLHVPDEKHNFDPNPKIFFTIGLLRFFFFLVDSLYAQCLSSLYQGPPLRHLTPVLVYNYIRESYLESI